jgi:hypothetical protein
MDPSGLAKRLKDAINKARGRLHAVSDQKEQDERESAAQAYLAENEKHYIDLLYDSVDQSSRALEDTRAQMAMCWDAYNEEEPPGFIEKEPWQSRTIVPKPQEAVNYGAAAIRKAFTPEFISVVDGVDKNDDAFWRDVLIKTMAKGRANFPHVFTKSTQMALAVGISKELVPYFVNGGIQFKSIDPWKIDRDPDAESEDPQSGSYWIHSEWVPWNVLRRREQSGVYQNIDKVMSGMGGGEVSGGLDSKNWWLQKEYIDRRKRLVYNTRSKFRPLYLTSVYCGEIIDPHGELLLDSGRFTACAGRIIQAPHRSRLRTKRWPGTSFSPLPNLISFSGGRGLLHGVLRVWEAMCNLMCLHEDALKWVVNPPREINIDLLENPKDVLMHPGKTVLTRSALHGQQAIRTQKQSDVTSSVLANLQYFDQLFQGGSNVSAAVQGLPGWRKNITYSESAQNLSQAMGIYVLMGSNIESGAVQALEVVREVIEAFFTYEDYMKLLGEEYLSRHNITSNGYGKVVNLPNYTGYIQASGIQSIMRDAEVLDYLVRVVIPLCANPRFAPFMRPYQILKALESRTNLRDEDLWVDKDVAEKIEAAEMDQFKNGIHINLLAQRQQMAQLVMSLLTSTGAQSAPSVNTGGNDNIEAEE